MKITALNIACYIYGRPFMTREIVYLVIYVKVHTGIAELDPLQVLCNDACTALKLAHYYVNLSNNTIPTIPSRNEKQQWKTHPWVHSLYYSIHACVLIPIITLYDVKPQSVKTPIAAKPSRISSNCTYQSSLSYSISPSDFSLQNTFTNVLNKIKIL